MAPGGESHEKCPGVNEYSTRRYMRHARVAARSQEICWQEAAGKDTAGAEACYRLPARLPVRVQVLASIPRPPGAWRQDRRGMLKARPPQSAVLQHERACLADSAALKAVYVLRCCFVPRRRWRYAHTRGRRRGAEAKSARPACPAPGFSNASGETRCSAWFSRWRGATH